MELTELVKKKSLVASFALLLVFCWATGVAAQDDNTWQFEASLYGWFPSIDGTIVDSGHTIPGGPFEIDTSDILDNLEMVFMGAFEGHKNKWSFLADVVYLDVGNDKNTIVTGRSGRPINASVGLDVTAWILSGIVGYDVVQSDRGTLAVVGGARYATVDTDVSLGILRQESTTSESESLLDGIVGVRGAIKLSEHWYLPYYADIGTGQSDLTWQLLGGVGYRFGWGDIKLVYRHLAYEMDGDKHLEDLTVSGPMLGVGFRF